MQADVNRPSFRGRRGPFPKPTHTSVPAQYPLPLTLPSQPPNLPSPPFQPRLGADSSRPFRLHLPSSALPSGRENQKGRFRAPEEMKRLETTEELWLPQFRGRPLKSRIDKKGERRGRVVAAGTANGGCATATASRRH